MEILKWLPPLLFSFAFGLLYVQFLTIHPLKMSRYLLATTLALVVAVVSLAIGFQGWQLLLAILLALVSALIGYVLMTRSPYFAHYKPNRERVFINNLTDQSCLAVTG